MDNEHYLGLDMGRDCDHVIAPSARVPLLAILIMVGGCKHSADDLVEPTFEEPAGWVRLGLDPAYSYLDFCTLGSNKLFVIGRKGYPLEPTVHALFASNDMGTTWTEVTNSNILNVTDQEYWGRVTFITEELGFITAEEHIWRTADGGDTWASIEFGEFIHSIVAFTPELLYARAYYGALYRTLDGGSSWTQVEGPLGFGSSWGGIDVLNSSCAFVTAGDVYRTDDAGYTWTLIPFPATGSSLHIDFVDDQRGCVVETITSGGEPVFTKLWLTEDGGMNWMSLDFDPDPSAYQTSRLHYHRFDRLLVSSFGDVAISTDQGWTWGWDHVATPSALIEKFGSLGDRVYFLTTNHGIWRKRFP